MKRALFFEKRPEPFLGHAGVGARFEMLPKENHFEVRETHLSQAKLLIPLALLAFYLPWILIFHESQIHGGIFGRGVLVLGSIVGLIFFKKYFVRFIVGRRIELRPSEQRLVLWAGNSEATRIIQFSELKKSEIVCTHWRDSHSVTNNYTYTFYTFAGERLELFCSESKVNVDMIGSQFSSLVPEVVQ